MADLPEPKNCSHKGKINKDILLAVLFLIFVVAAIGSMMAIDAYGDAKMGATASVRDAANDH